ncbi:MAG: hypothetical protein NXI20_02545, partial [bacterium]|nr:hypothetical protein [bacterium]
KWIMPDPNAEDQEIKVPITKEMVPNAYITLTAIQEHAQTVNDRPLRMFGILPIGVKDKSTNQELLINMADELKPKEKFDIEIKSADGKPTQFTIAVVDEGLLDLTNFKTPDPKKEFFKKIRLEVETYDLFAHVIGANADDVFKTFSIGGDEDYRESQLDPFEKKKRFKPICMFKGPVSTDGTGKAKVSFEMPNYVGSVRVMVVGARGNTYSSAEKTVPVKSDLIVQPTIPRALKPGDEFEIPVNVFATKENIGEVDIKIETEGPLTVIGSKSFKHSFQKEDDKLFKYKLKVNEAVGQAKITIKGISKTATSVSETDIAVLPSAAREYVQETKIVKPGESIQFDIPKVGLDGTNNARIYASQFPNMDFMHRLEWLVRYPYGCIEQTTSSVYPQLVLKELYSKNSIRWKQVDTNINAGIERLNLFQTPNGGFSYWPGGVTESTWGSNYAAQFLIEAKDKGFHVPDHMYDGVIRYLERQTKRSQNETENWQLMTRVNRCFVLAQAGKAPMQEMNLIRQNHYDKLKSVQKWQLVAAYKLAGAEDKIESLIGAIDLDVEEYNEFAYTYGSTYRDLGIILRCLVILDKSEQSALVAKDVASKLSGKYWYSTQTLGQMLLGIAEYFKYAGISVQEEVIIRGTATLPGGNEVEFEEVNDYRLYIDKGYGEKLTFSLDQNVDAKQLYVSLSANGVPLTDKTKDEEKNIRLDVTWFNEDGDVVSIDQLEQGSTVYGKYTVNNSSALPHVDEVALVQLLPSGWEIENMRLSGEVLPEWTKGWNLGREEYVDIRDDRIMWFFDLNGSRRLNFLVKINAIAAGTYSMPGARCEAMYNNDFVATKTSKQVVVKVEN